nr:protein ae7-like 1 [Quercus suber]
MLQADQMDQMARGKETFQGMSRRLGVCEAEVDILLIQTGRCERQRGQVSSLRMCLLWRLYLVGRRSWQACQRNAHTLGMMEQLHVDRLFEVEKNGFGVAWIMFWTWVGSRNDKVARDIRDPEHPYSLEQLSVLSEESITVDEKLGRILITFTPTIQHCSMATVIGLCLRVKLKHCFPPHYKVDIKVSPGSHANEESVNKQLNDKERVAAALENPNLRQLVDECLCSSEL